jgi:hypothetical protein
MGCIAFISKQHLALDELSLVRPVSRNSASVDFVTGPGPRPLKL